MTSPFKRGMVLRAKPTHHMRRVHGSDGIVVVIENDPQYNVGMWIHWVNGNPQLPGFEIDSHPDGAEWFDIIPEEEHHKYLPEGYQIPPRDVEGMMGQWLGDVIGAALK